MKTFLTTLAITLMSVSALASNKYTRCDLQGTAAEDVEELKTYNVRKGTDVTRLQAHLIMQTAHWEAEMNDYDHEIETLTDAIEALVGNSKYDDLVIKTLRIDGEIFTAVVHYPGDNEYGLLFEGSKPAIEIQDGDFYCPRK